MEREIWRFLEINFIFVMFCFLYDGEYGGKIFVFFYILERVKL